VKIGKDNGEEISSTLSRKELINFSTMTRAGGRVQRGRNGENMKGKMVKGRGASGGGKEGIGKPFETKGIREDVLEHKNRTECQ